jgi:hypothetical protein
MTAVAAFKAAFPLSEYSSDDVQLWIKGFQTPEHQFDDPRISFMRGDFNDAAMREMYRSCHILLSATRGEGFGLPIFEGMAHGLIPMVTNWSAPAEFLDDTFSFPIPVRRLLLMEKDFPGNPFDPANFGNYENLGYWADPQFDALVDMMVVAYEARGTLKSMASTAYLKALSMPVDDMVERTIEVVTGDISVLDGEGDPARDDPVVGIADH